MKTNMQYRVGEWVEVRSKEEILRTLDTNGQIDGMPFMPEMFAFCGKRFRVYKRGHKTCDTVFPIRGRRVARAIHLETRCDGQAHGGCQAGCLIFWKEAWLKPATARDPADAGSHARSTPLIHISPAPGCPEEKVIQNVHAPGPHSGPVPYVCQTTHVQY